MSGFKDEYFEPVFGRKFNQWTDQDIEDFETVAVTCYRKYSREMHVGYKRYSQHNKISDQRFNDLNEIYSDGQVYIANRLTLRSYSEYSAYDKRTGVVRTYSQYVNSVDAYPVLMAHQREIYPEYKNALSLVGIQNAKAKSMSATKANILELVSMGQNAQLAFLRPDEMNDHKVFLDNHVVALTDHMIRISISNIGDMPETLEGLQELQALYSRTKNDLRELRSRKWVALKEAYESRTRVIAIRIVDKAVSDLNDFSNDLDGLKKLTAFREKIQESLGRTRVPNWSDFEKAYAIAINSRAEAAIGDFEQELSNLPATTTNLTLVRRAVNDLFKYRPTPPNMQAYLLIAKEQESILRQELLKMTCYTELANIDLDEDDRDLAILGYQGESTLGLFICAINKRRYKFQEYDSAGLFSSTSTLSILSPRGITLSIDMEEVEAVKDREMLVGVLVKDATSETKLTLSTWQDYAGRLTGR